MKANTDSKQMRLSAQIALALTLGTAFVPTAALSAPITSSRTYTADATVSEDIDISSGTITVEAVNDDSTGRYENRTVELKGSSIKILNPTGNILAALSRGDGTMDFSGVLKVNPDGAGKVGLRGAPRAGLSLSARYRTGCGAGNLPGCRLRLGTCGVEQLLVDEDGPSAELVTFTGTGRSGGRRLGCIVVRHEFPLSRVQHHAIPDRPGRTRRRPDRPEANAPTGADSRARSAGSGRRNGFAGSRSSRSPPALPASNPDEHHQRTDGADGGARVGPQRDER